MALKLFLIAWFCYPLCYCAMAQKPQKLGMERIDSLMIKLPLIKDDTDKVKLLADLSYTYYRINTDKGLFWGEKARLLAIKLNYKKGEARAYSSLGSNYWEKHDYIMSQELHLKALKINASLGDKREMARNIHNIATIYETEHNPIKAITYYKKALVLLEEIKDTDNIIAYSTDLAYALEGYKEYPQALAYMQKCLQLSEKMHDPQNIATYLAGVGFMECSLKNYALAIEYNKKALKIFYQLGSTDPWKDDIASSFRTIAKAYFRENDNNKALVFYRAAYNEYKRLQGNEQLANSAICLAGIGEVYLRMGTKPFIYIDLDSNIGKLTTSGHPLFIHRAVDTLSLAVQTLKSVGEWESLLEFLPVLAKAQQLEGNYPLALKTIDQYVHYKDSVYNNEMEKKTAIRQIEYEYSQQKDSINTLNKLQSLQLSQENELIRLKSKQQWLFIAIAIILLSLVVIYFVYRNRLAKNKLQYELERKQELKDADYQSRLNDITFAALRSQMNPHFIFNCLNSIKLYTEQNNSQAASEYLSKFAQLIRSTLNNARQEKILLSEEITQIELYLALEAMRFKEKLAFNITVDNNVDLDFIEIPPMLVQPYVENAIWHGLMQKKKRRQHKHPFFAGGSK